MDKTNFYQAGVRSGKKYMAERMEMCGEFSRQGMIGKHETELRNIVDMGCTYGEVIAWLRAKREEFIKEQEGKVNGNNLQR